MIILIFYLTAAVLLLAFAVLLVGQERNHDNAIRFESEREIKLRFLEDPGLDLAERIFDPADYLWLHEELRFPELAKTLARHRKVMALRWLRELRTSFNELIRVPEETSAGENNNSTGWGMTFLTLRFQFLLAYAMMVVWVFGPYTRIAPSFGWLRPLLGRGTHKERYGLHA